MQAGETKSLVFYACESGKAAYFVSSGSLGGKDVPIACELVYQGKIVARTMSKRMCLLRYQGEEGNYQVVLHNNTREYAWVAFMYVNMDR